MANPDYPEGAFFKPQGAMSERRSKDVVRDRDGRRYCRVYGPGCVYAAKPHTRFDAAHIVAKGIGGDKLAIRSQSSNMVRCCMPHHTGKHSLHSGHLRVECLTDRGADGPIRTWERQQAEWYVLHEEAA